MNRGRALKLLAAVGIISLIPGVLVVATRAAIADKRQQSEAQREPIPTFATVRTGVLEVWLPGQLRRTPLFSAPLRGPSLPAGYEPTITQVVAPGAPILAGSRIVEVATRPVFLFVGGTPAFRDMQSGDRGADIEALQSGLVAAGFRGVRNDSSGAYGPATAAGVREFYARNGYATNAQGAALDGGRVALGDVLFLPSAPARLTRPLAVGMSLSGNSAPVIETIASSYSVELHEADAARVHPDDPVRSDAATPPTELGRVGAALQPAHPSEPDAGNSDQVAPATRSFELLTPMVLDSWPDKTAVRVRVASSNTSGLIVPSVALSGTPEATWVQLVEASGSSVVNVRVGLCALGECVITSADQSVHSGSKLLIPNTTR